ncbi:MAG: DUF4290 domain-containing protein [Bacteroidetes bacterium]|nr:DUF4290 domain-containing protein [Bacteroidota bacterium]MBL6963482.1 DUF4290 domain-containing protein [Bacteroidota bacterium]
MEYNTNRAKLNMPEYGRNLQILVDYVVEIPEREERNKAAEVVINMMAQQNPQLRNQPEFMQKLWSHLFIMADHKLDVDSPFVQSDYDKLKEDYRTKIGYPQKDFKYRFYGKNVELMIKRCCEMDDGEVKEQFKMSIASYMRMSYKLWNDEKVSDEIVLGHLRELSGGKILIEKIPEHLKTYDTKPAFQKENKKFKSRSNFSRKNNNRNYRSKS